MSNADKIRTAVRERYADAAKTVSSCCGPIVSSTYEDIGANPFGQVGYGANERSDLPEEAQSASLATACCAGSNCC